MSSSKREKIRREKVTTHVGAELEVGSSGTDVGIVGVVKMSVKDLLGKGERAVETATSSTIKRRQNARETTLQLRRQSKWTLSAPQMRKTRGGNATDGKEGKGGQESGKSRVQLTGNGRRRGCPQCVGS